MSKSPSLAVEIPQAKVTGAWENIVRKHHYSPLLLLLWGHQGGDGGDHLDGPSVSPQLPVLIQSISAQRIASF